MKLSLVFELLLIFILLAFAASKSVRKEKNTIKKVIQNRNDDDKLEENSINKYCKCVEAYCNCCREFRLPVVELNGPGCASLMYLNGDKMSVSLSFGKKVITNRTLSSRKPSPVCMPLPGGISKFCGRVYNIARAGEEFRACLGLELQSKSTVEAAVRVSCFKFGPRGVTSEPADPLPLVPQDEKAEDDDDDYEDDDDDFGLGGDDDDDDDDDEDDDGTLDAVNDVDSADYAGFSLLGEDILGDLFGSSSGKKSNKNKKKQAPAPSTSTTTTTRRPRPSRRPSRRPSTRTTTPRPKRTTTVRVRPTGGNRRPTRRPNRRPSRKPTTENISTSVLTSTTTTTTTTTARTVPSSVTAAIQTTEISPVMSPIQEQSVEPISVVTENRTPIISASTPKSVTDFEYPGLEMSLAHITGQLSSLPVTPMLSNENKETSVTVKEEETPNYEKILTITPKTPSTVAFVVPTSEEVPNDDMIQIVQTLDSAENIPEREPISAEESRGHQYQFGLPVPDSYYEGLTLPKKKHRNTPFDLHDLDVLNLGQIGESLGHELGIFGKNKRQNRGNEDVKVHGEKEHSDEYDDMVDTLGDMALMMRKSSDNNKNKKDRRRQNKMMRGVWSEV